MATTRLVPVRDLNLDLRNFRTTPQTNECEAVQSMISISPDRFWALMESLIDDGYLSTENILVLKTDSAPSQMIVREGNRRIAALKLIHGYLVCPDIAFPQNIADRMAGLTSAWKASNNVVPCTIYDAPDSDIVDRIVTRAHGKGEKAGRDQWNAVARARHNRDVNGAGEPALDLLEKYLAHGRNRTPQQAHRWAGDYPLTVLDEAIKRIATRMGAVSAPDVARRYPNISYRDALEDILLDIGLKKIGFETIRARGKDFAAPYGVPPSSTSSSSRSGLQTGTAGAGGGASGAGTGGSQGGSSSGSTSGSGAGASGTRSAAAAIQTPQAVKAILKKFVPLGNNRQKVVTLRDEALSLNLTKNPIAFCFILRSMFEISAKAYCDDHASSGLSYKKQDGTDKSLEVVLRDITGHMTNGRSDRAMLRVLHGAMTELGRREGILSVTSMNQLVHNPAFSVTTGDICTLFGNVFPLLEAMN